MIRASLGLLSVLVLFVTTSPVEAQQQYSRSSSAQRTLLLPSQKSNTILEAYRGNGHYVVPFRRPIYVPVPKYAPYYQSYRPRWSYHDPVYGRSITTTSRSGRSFGNRR